MWPDPVSPLRRRHHVLCWALRLEGRRLLVGSLEKTPCVRRGPGEKIPKPSAGRRGKGSTEPRQTLGSELDFCGAGEPKLWLTVSWGGDALGIVPPQRPLYLESQRHGGTCLPQPWAGALGRNALAPCPQEEL